MQVVKGCTVVAHSMVARRQRTIGTCYLVDIAIGGKQPQGGVGQGNIGSMVGQSLQGLCLEIGITLTMGDAETAVEHLHLVSMYLLRVVACQNAASTNVIEVVQILRSIAANGIDVQRQEGIDGLALKADIVIIG